MGEGKICFTTACRQLVTKSGGQIPAMTLGNDVIGHLDTGCIGSFQSSSGNSINMQPGLKSTDPSSREQESLKKRLPSMTENRPSREA